MPDSGSTPAPTPETPEKKVKRGAFDKKKVQLLDLARKAGIAAAKSDYAAGLAAEDIDAAFVAAFNDDVAECARRFGRSVDATTDKEQATVDERSAKEVLVGGLRQVQAKARRKYRGSVQLKDYFVGDNISISRAHLIEVADAIITKLGTDTIPGFGPASLAILKGKRDAYVRADSTQTDDQSLASGKRVSTDELLKSITQRRIEIQLAADSAYPPNVPANRPIRREFEIPPMRPFTP